MFVDMNIVDGGTGINEMKECKKDRFYPWLRGVLFKLSALLEVVIDCQVPGNISNV